MAMAAEISKPDTVAKAGVTGLCAGANVRTPCGPRRVEFLRQGDLVVTRDNGLQPVRAIWTRVVTAAEIAADPSLAPLVIRPRAIGPMMPQRTLSVGGAHRLLIPGWRLLDVDDRENSLVPARDISELSDETFVDRATEEDVTYYNVVFDEPQVLAVNGLPVESYQPTRETLSDVPRDARDALKRAFPDLAPKKFADYPAPRYKLRERVSYDPNFA